jgi:uncharacterized protein (DUF1810 family)
MPPIGWPAPVDLTRFVLAQEADYETALSEIRSGRKRSHWMWYIFPQYEGLGSSAMSRRYAIRSRAEAEAYLIHPVLGPRLLECAEAVVNVEGRSAFEIFGHPDDVKLRSCATLFAGVSPQGSVFERLLDKYFRGERDGETLRLLGIAAAEAAVIRDDDRHAAARRHITAYRVKLADRGVHPDRFEKWVATLPVEAQLEAVRAFSGELSQLWGAKPGTREADLLAASRMTDQEREQHQRSKGKE